VAAEWPGTDADSASAQAAAGRERRGHQRSVVRRGVATGLEPAAEIDGAVRAEGAEGAEGARAAPVPRPSPAGPTAAPRPRMGAHSAAEAVTMARLETTVELWSGADAHADVSVVTGRDASGSTGGTGPGLLPRPGRPPGDVDDAWDDPAAPAQVPLTGALRLPVPGPTPPSRRRRRPGTESGITATEPEVTVQVSIGRIEVRLADPGRELGGRAGQGRTRPGLLSLEDYSARRGGRR
jgi:hypothetical protein